MMNKLELLAELKRASDMLDGIEHQLPYDYEQHDPDNAFLAHVRQQIYSVRCALGGVRETIKDPRNWHDGCNPEECGSDKASLQQW